MILLLNMINIFKKSVTIFFLIILFFPFIVFSEENEGPPVYDEPTSGANLQNAFGPGSNVEDVAEKSGFKIDTDEETTIINRALSAIINTVLSVLGLIFVILTILAGFKWMTASGNQEQVNKAKASLKQNVIGLLIVVVSWGIWSLILQVISQF